MKNNSQLNLSIALICFGVGFYHLYFNTLIMSHPYMLLLVFGLLSIGGYNLGIAISKINNK